MFGRSMPDTLVKKHACVSVHICVQACETSGERVGRGRECACVSVCGGGEEGYIYIFNQRAAETFKISTQRIKTRGSTVIGYSALRS